MKILIFGLPGSGKSTLAKTLQEELDCAWYNADVIRKAANDWDFSELGRIRQANRMKSLADYEDRQGRIVICDFVAPYESSRCHFEADLEIWMNTIEAGRYEDTNKVFEEPNLVDIEVKGFLSDDETADLIQLVKTYCADAG